MLTQQMFNVKQLCFQAEFVQNRLHDYTTHTQVVNFSKLVLKINLQRICM